MPIDAEGLAALEEPTPDVDDLEEDDLDFGLSGDEGDTKEAEDDTKEAEDDTKEAEDDTKEAEDAPEDEEPAKEPATKKRGRNGHMIPQHRYNYATQKREEAEARAAELEAELAAARAKDKTAQPTAAQKAAQIEDIIIELDTEIEQARADNDVAKAAKLRGEQRVAERHLAKLERGPAPDPDASSRQAVETVRTEQVIERLEADYPALDSAGDHYDEELSEEVMDLFEALSRRMTRDKALARAASYVLEANGISKSGPANKRKTNVKKNLRAAGNQPPDIGSAGLDSHKGGAKRRLDVMQMSQEDFEKLGDNEIEELLNSD